MSIAIVKKIQNLLKNLNQLALVVPVYIILDTYETDAGELQIQSLPRSQCELKASLGNLIKPYLKINVKESWG